MNTLTGFMGGVFGVVSARTDHETITLRPCQAPPKLPRPGGPRHDLGSSRGGLILAAAASIYAACRGPARCAQSGRAGHVLALWRSRHRLKTKRASARVPTSTPFAGQVLSTGEGRADRERACAER